MTVINHFVLDTNYGYVLCSGEELSATLEDLRPATDYHVRLSFISSCFDIYLFFNYSINE